MGLRASSIWVSRAPVASGPNALVISDRRSAFTSGSLTLSDTMGAVSSRKLLALLALTSPKRLIPTTTNGSNIGVMGAIIEIGWNGPEAAKETAENLKTSRKGQAGGF